MSDIYEFDGYWYGKTAHGAIGPFPTRSRAENARIAVIQMDYLDESEGKATYTIHKATNTLPSERIDRIYGNMGNVAHACELYAGQFGVDIVAYDEDANILVYRTEL